MILERIILGLLSISPMTGYDVLRAFHHTARHFWSADKAQVYRTLARLVESGHARVQTVSGQNAPDRQVHHITDSGRAALSAWLTSELDRQPERDAFVARIFFGGIVESAELARVIDNRQADVNAALEELLGVRTRSAPLDSAADRAEWLRSMTLELGIRQAQVISEWLDDLQAGLNKWEQI